MRGMDGEQRRGDESARRADEPSGKHPDEERAARVQQQICDVEEQRVGPPQAVIGGQSERRQGPEEVPARPIRPYQKLTQQESPQAVFLDLLDQEPVVPDEGA